MTDNLQKIFYYPFNKDKQRENNLFYHEKRFFCNSGKLLLLPYTKGFGRITHFLGNDLATVLYTAFCLDLLFKQLVGYKCTKDIGTIIQKREKASTLL